MKFGKTRKTSPRLPFFCNTVLDYCTSVLAGAHFSYILKFTQPLSVSIPHAAGGGNTVLAFTLNYPSSPPPPPAVTVTERGEGAYAGGSQPRWKPRRRDVSHYPPQCASVPTTVAFWRVFAPCHAHTPPLPQIGGGSLELMRSMGKARAAARKCSIIRPSSLIQWPCAAVLPLEGWPCW